MGWRSRSRSRGSRNWTRLAFLALVVGGIVVGAGTPTASFTVGSAERDANVDIVQDDDGILRLQYPDNVSRGEENRLVEVTNFVGRNVSVTVSLQNGSSDEADLVVDGTNVGDSVTFDLTEQESQQVNVTVSCDAGDALYWQVHATAPGFEGIANRSVNAVGSCGVGAAFADASSTELYTAEKGSTTKYGPTGINVVGPAADVDADGDADVPFVSGTDGDLELVDAGGERQLLVDGDAASQKSRMAVGSWNGSSASVFYVNASDNDYIYRADLVDGSVVTEQLTSSSLGQADAIGGLGDVDGDGKKELVFADGSGVYYLDDDGDVVKTGFTSMGSNKGVGIGDPHDFDGDGYARIPVVGSNTILLLNATNGNTEKIVASGVEKTAIATEDWDGDGAMEIVYLDKSTHELLYADRDTTGEWVTVTPTNTHTADPEPGVA